MTHEGDARPVTSCRVGPELTSSYKTHKAIPILEGKIVLEVAELDVVVVVVMRAIKVRVLALVIATQQLVPGNVLQRTVMPKLRKYCEYVAVGLAVCCAPRLRLQSK